MELLTLFEPFHLAGTIFQGGRDVGAGALASGRHAHSTGLAGRGIGRQADLPDM